MIKISVVINTLNEEKNIYFAIKSVNGFADEIVVLDMNSDDKTIEVAKKLGALVFSHKRTNYVEPARNFAISKAQGEWILVLDADERLTPRLAKKLTTMIKESKFDYARIPRKNIVFGKWLKHSRWWPDYNIRFFKKGTVTWNEVIHSVPMTTGVGLDLLPKEKYALVHHHYKNIDQYLTRMMRYTGIQAELKHKEGIKTTWSDFIVKPTDEFLSRYFMGRGYKDGVHGLVVSLLQAFSELVLYIKLWQMDKFKEFEVSSTEVIGEIKKVQQKLNYWNADTLYKENHSILQRIRRKLRI